MKLDKRAERRLIARVVAIVMSCMALALSLAAYNIRWSVLFCLCVSTVAVIYRLLSYPSAERTG